MNGLYHNDPRYQIVGVNDSSLPMGGRFDICAIGGGNCPGVRPWIDPHVSHMWGFDVDFRYSATLGNSIIVDPIVKNRFQQICVEKGSQVTLDEGDHVHCRFFIN